MKHLAIITAFLIAACGTVTAPQSPAQGVFAAKAAYASALTVAVAYKQLPSCAPANHPPICSDAAIVKSLQDRDDIAAPALDAAERAVRTPGFGQSALQTFVISANNAVASLTDITSKLRVK